MKWEPFEQGTTIGTTGSEEGEIIRDEEWKGAARITIERGGEIAPFAITCGMYDGWRTLVLRARRKKRSRSVRR